jgi:hypothetical protein
VRDPDPCKSLFLWGRKTGEGVAGKWRRPVPMIRPDLIDKTTAVERGLGH